MSLRINNNIESMNAHRSLLMNDRALSKSLERLLQTLRICACSIYNKNNIFITIMGIPHLNYIIQTQLSMLTTTDSLKNRTTPQSNAHYETILPKMKHSAIILVQLLLG